jgi:LIM domain kinase 1
MSPRSPVVLDETDTSYIPLEELEFDKAIGEGAFGKVYKGTWRGEESAIKSMRLKDDKMRAQITREIGVLRELTHYAIVHFKGISKRDDELLLVMELVKGGELYDLIIDKDVVMTWTTKITIGADIAGALAYLHSKHIIHRDIKSENILCDSDFHVKLCDFGFARIAQQASRMSLCGSFYFNAPELLLGNPYNEKVDVYSFGIVCCELLTRGKVDLTRTADSKYSLDVKLMRQSIPDDCPPNLWKVAFSCCNFNPDERPPAGKVAEFLLTIKKAYARAEKKSKGSKAKELSSSEGSEI